MASDLRIVLIKLADILDNLQTLRFLTKEEQLTLGNETLEIFAPLSERLGMSQLRGDMQDLVFPYLYPQEYLETKKLLKINEEKLQRRMLKIKSDLKIALDTANIAATVESRTKHLYSLYTKLKRPEINFDISKVYDLIALRVIVETEEQCYQTLDIVHQLWKPVPNRVFDYITQPKPNGYKSLHTTVVGPWGESFEIQIRTKKMHEEAEYGIAAHWNYSDEKQKNTSDQKLSQGVTVDEKRLGWVQSLSKWQEEVVDNEEFLSSIKTDFFGTRIFVFTPKGDVKDLPANATPIDFAYSVHTTLGDRASGAKVNGKMVPLQKTLKNGDVVEILLAKDTNKKPNRDWLKFVVTSLAKNRIKKSHGLIVHSS